MISQIGLILLLSQIGMDFAFAHMRERRNTTAVVVRTSCSVSVPFALGLVVGHIPAPELAPGIDSAV